MGFRGFNIIMIDVLIFYKISNDIIRLEKYECNLTETSFKKFLYSQKKLIYGLNFIH